MYALTNIAKLALGWLVLVAIMLSVTAAIDFVISDAQAASHPTMQQILMADQFAQEFKLGL